MEKELYLESVGDAGILDASKSCICVLKPPHYLWMTMLALEVISKKQGEGCF